MKKIIHHFRLPATTIVSFYLITAALLSSCGGGGGSSDEADNEPLSGNTQLQSAFEQQNTTVDDYFSKINRLLSTVNSLEGDIAVTSSTDDNAQSLIVNEVDEKIIPLSDAVSTAGDLVIQAEGNIQELLPFQQQASLGVQRTTVSPSAALSAVFSGVCYVTSLTSYVTSSNDNFDQYRRDLAQCTDFHKRWIMAKPSGMSVEETNAYLDRGWGYFKDCMNEAKADLHEADTNSTAGLFFGILGPEGIATDLARLVTSSYSFLLDAGQIYLWGTRPKEDERAKAQEANKLGSLTINRANENLDMFITTVDSEGKFIAPVGEWNIVIFKKGYVRLGNPQGELVSVSAGEPNEINVEPIAIDQITHDDLTCGADDNGNFDFSGSMSGSFSAECSDGYSDGSNFSVTIASDGSVSGSYDWGSLAGGVQDGFMSVQFDGDWSDCVMGGYLNGSGTNLSGSGTISCSGSSCYGSWSASAQ